MTQRVFYPSLIFYKLKKESTRSSTNKRTKTFYRDYLHCIRNFSIKQQQISKTSQGKRPGNEVGKQIQSSYESTVETTVEMKLLGKFHLCLHNFSKV